MVLLKLILMLVLIFVLVYFSKQKELFFQMDGYQFETCNEIWSDTESEMRTLCVGGGDGSNVTAAVDGCIVVNGWCGNDCFDRDEVDCKNGCKWNSDYDYGFCDIEYDSDQKNIKDCWEYNTTDICNKQPSCTWSEPQENPYPRCVTDDSIVGTTAAGTTATGTTAASGNGGGKSGVKKNTKKPTCIEVCGFYEVNSDCARHCRKGPD